MSAKNIFSGSDARSTADSIFLGSMPVSISACAVPSTTN